MSAWRLTVGLPVVMSLIGMLATPALGQFGGGGGGGGRNNNQQVGEAILGGLILGAAINQAMQPPRRQSNQSYPSNSSSRPQQYYPSQQQQYYPARQGYSSSSRPIYSTSEPIYSQSGERIISSSRPISSQTISSQTISSQPVERIISSQPVERVISSGETITTAKPVITSETIVAPKPNVVKESPKPNASLKSLAASLAVADGSAADPLLAVTAQQSVAKSTETIGEFVAASGSPEMKADWQKVVDGGSAAGDVAEWWRKHGAAVNDAAVKAVEPVHLGMSKLVQDLQDGLLSNAGKKSAIDKIAEMVSGLPAGHRLRPGFVADLGRMRQFQKLGELLGLASVAPDPIVPILQGTEAMGMPVTVVAEMLEVPLMHNPVADSEPLASNISIRVVNPSTNVQSVNCAIGGRQVEMAPGNAESLTSSSSVAFDPGNGNRRSVAVTAGTWAWKIENGLWSLSRVTPKITIDNSKYKAAFLYTVNGKHASVAAGQTAEHSHTMPIEISFDRGNGAGTATKVVTFGTYAVGVDTSSRGLELFRTDVQEVPPPSLSATSTKAAAGTPSGGTAGDRVRKALENAEKQKELSKLLQSLKSEK